jgi:hypothetical protein
MWPVWIMGFCIGTACVGLWGIARGILIGFMAAIIAGIGWALFGAFGPSSAGQETYLREPLFVVLASITWSAMFGIGVLFGTPIGFMLRKRIGTVQNSN